MYHVQLCVYPYNSIYALFTHIVKKKVVHSNNRGRLGGFVWHNYWYISTTPIWQILCTILLCILYHFQPTFNKPLTAPHLNRYTTNMNLTTFADTQAIHGMATDIAFELYRELGGTLHETVNGLSKALNKIGYTTKTSRVGGKSRRIYVHSADFHQCPVCGHPHTSRH